MNRVATAGVAAACLLAFACNRSPAASGDAPTTASTTGGMGGPPPPPPSAAPALSASPTLTAASAAVPAVAAPLTASAPLTVQEGFRRLYDCARKTNYTYYEASFPFVPNRDYELRLLEPDFFYLLDARAPELYLYTPRSSIKADLPRIIKRNGTSDYGVRVPYLSGETSKPKGYYYLQLRDGRGNVSLAGIDRFLPGAPQSTPDFTNYTPPQQPNGVTLMSVTGQKDSGVEYYPSADEAHLWERSAGGHFSEDAERALVSLLHFMLSNLSPPHEVGQRSDCWGHLGCDYTYDEARVAAERRARSEALRSCKSADESHLGLF
jgi:hypothetical protein